MRKLLMDADARSAVEEVERFAAEAVGAFPDDTSLRSTVRATRDEPLIRGGMRLPAFTCTGVTDAKPVQLGRPATGKRQLLAFVTTTCGACAYLKPDLERVLADSTLRGLEVTTVFVNANADAVARYAVEKGPFPGRSCWLDEAAGAELDSAAHLSSFPVSLVVNSEGDVTIDPRELPLGSVYQRLVPETVRQLPAPR